MVEPTAGVDTLTLGAFLQRRRAAVDPATAGLPGSGPRRVTGLRREEVAVLAGMSVDYYTRLEQGRERHPSPQVLDSLCRALGLGADARRHLFRLAGDDAVAQSDLLDLPDPVVTPELRLLLDQLRESPALVLSPALDMLARNDLADRMYAGFDRADNSARMCFLDPAGRDFYRPWPAVAAGVVATLRLAAGRWPDHARLFALVEELRAASAEFESLWQTQSVGEKRNETREFRHPVVGTLLLDYQSFDVRGVTGQQLIVYTAAAATPTAARLSELRAAGRSSERP